MSLAAFYGQYLYTTPEIENRNVRNDEGNDDSGEESDHESTLFTTSKNLQIKGETPLRRMKNFCRSAHYEYNYGFIEFGNGVLCELNIYGRSHVFDKARFIQTDQTIEDAKERVKNCKSIAKDILAAIFLEEVCCL